LVVASASAAIAAEPVAVKYLFGAVTAPTEGPARSIGSYARGCLAGGAQLAIDGPNWQVMRLSRNRNWGNPVAVAYIEKFSRDVAARDGWNGLLVGDMSQPRGGPMRTGHASHQIGLDIDIWLTPMPKRTLTGEERESMSATSLLMTGRLAVDPKRWSDAFPRLLKRAASYPEVARIFVSAAIKKQLCETVGADRAWLRKIRPWWGHDYHFHVRLVCPPGMAGCKNQEPPGPGDGCGAELAEWFKPRPPPKKPTKPPPELTLADLPAACGDVLNEGGGAVASAAKAGEAAPLPRARPSGGG
jgi:penicillin-insensitive murein endopeptidase